MQGSSNKSDVSAEEYGKASVHTRLQNPKTTGAVVQTTSENDTEVKRESCPVNVWLSDRLKL